MTSDDIRAVENPISAVFDLAEDVNDEVPKVRRLVTYATAFIVIWLTIDFIFIIAFIGRNLLIGTSLILLFIMGLLTLSMLQHINDFFRYYTVRHQAIKSVRDDDPVVYAPKGKDAVERLYQHLLAKNSYIGYVSGGSLPGHGIARGRSGTFYEFDLHIVGRPGICWRLLGIGFPGYQLSITKLDRAPRVEDVMSVKRAVEDVSAANRVPPTRTMILWQREGEDDLDDQTYEALTTQVAYFSHRGKRYASTMELVIENLDGTYEFIPYVADSGSYSFSRTH